MSQNLISLSLSAADLTAIDGALTTLEQKLAGLLDLSPDQRKSLTKMGDGSEAFCRETLNVLAQNPNIIPGSFNLGEAQSDLANVDAVRPRLARVEALREKLNDTEMALGSDVMVAALEGYALAKVVGKGAGLDALRQQMGARFARGPRKQKQPA